MMRFFVKDQDLQYVDLKVFKDKSVYRGQVKKKGSLFDSSSENSDWGAQASDNQPCQGYGMKIYTDKSSYEGLWKNNSREGKGVFIDKDGQVFRGFFVNDKYFGIDQMSPNTAHQFSNIKT